MKIFKKMQDSNFFSKESLSKLFEKKKNTDDNNNNNSQKRIKIHNDEPQNIGVTIDPPIQLNKWKDPNLYSNNILRSDGNTTPLVPNQKGWENWTPEYRKELWKRENELRKHPYYPFAITIAGLVSTDAVKYLNTNFISSHSALERELRKENLELLKIRTTAYKDIPVRITNLLEIRDRNNKKVEEYNGYIKDIKDKLKRYIKKIEEYEKFLYINLVKEIINSRTLDTDLHKKKLSELFDDYFNEDYLMADTTKVGFSKYKELFETIKKVTGINNILVISSYPDFNKYINSTDIKTILQSEIKDVSEIYKSINEILYSLVNSKKVFKSGSISIILNGYERNKTNIESEKLDEIHKEILLEDVKQPFIRLVKKDDVLEYLSSKPIGVIKKGITEDGIIYLANIVIAQLEEDIKKQEKFIEQNTDMIIILQKREDELSSGIDTQGKPEYEVDYDTSFNSLNTGIISLDPIMGHILLVRNTIITQVNTKLKNKPVHWFLTDDRIIFLFAKAVSLEIKNTRDNYGSSWHHSDSPDRLKQEKSSIYGQIAQLKIV